MKKKVLSMLVLLAAVATGAVAQTTHKVSMKEGTEDATHWTITPAGATTTGVAAGTEVKATYSGTKRVKSVKAVKKVAAELGHALSASVVGDIVGSDGKAYAVADKDKLPQGVTAVAMVAYKSETAGSSLALQLSSDPVQKNWSEAKTYAEGLTAVSGGTWRLPSNTDWQNMFVGCAKSGDAGAGSYMSPIAGFKEKIGATGITWLSGIYWSSTPNDYYAYIVEVKLGSTPRAQFDSFGTSNPARVLGCLAF